MSANELIISAGSLIAGAGLAVSGHKMSKQHKKNKEIIDKIVKDREEKNKK
jgi:hypothetical protein